MLMISRYASVVARVAIALWLLLAIAVTWSMSASPAVGHAPAATPAALPIVAATGRCADLNRFDLTAIGGRGSRVAHAEEVAGIGGAIVCSVTGTLAPSIGFRVDLPRTSWTQRLLQTGCGGLCGNVNLEASAADGCPTLATGGFVLASTDMGHQGMAPDFGLDPRKRADFAYRGVHLTTLTAKALIRAFYGRAERYAYFDGCSDGGREALVEAERFPQDFDGIVAGAPALNFTVQNSFYHGWQARSNTGADGKPILLAPRLGLLHAAVVKACDALDGQTDGLVSAPGACRFDPMTLVCRAGQDPATCLSAAEATVARRFYDGPRDPKSGERLTQGGPLPGSELQWAGVYVPFAADQPIFSTRIANGAMANLIFADGRPATVDGLSFDRATFDRLRERHRLFDASSADLSAFAAHGGKLILFHGLADPQISPLNTIAFHDALRRYMGVARAQAFERLYLMPGMGHCSGGEGPSKFDLLTAVMAWVERGRAPDAIMTRTPTPEEQAMHGPPGGLRPGGPGAGGPGPGGPGGPPAGHAPDGMGPPPGLPMRAVALARSRPVYPYPVIAGYKRHGNRDAGENWTRGKAMPIDVPTWAGADYYTPYPGETGKRSR